jgi:predicted nucleic acid-binding protein
MSFGKFANRGQCDVIFDTNIFIYADRGLDSAKELLLSTPSRAISAITYMEYVPFCRNKRELDLFNGVLKNLRIAIYDVDQEISMTSRRLVNQFSLSYGVEMADALIASTALKFDEVLCTSNAKHFLPIAGVNLHVFKP